MRHKHIKYTIQQNNVKILHNPSAELKADIFTKGLKRVKFERMYDKIDVFEILNVKHDTMGQQNMLE